jgi:putative ABC transport system substrate-binding protein
MTITIGRRKFISALGSVAVAWPCITRAQQPQQPAMPVIGLLSPGSASSTEGEAEAFRRGLAEAGYVEGRNVMIEYRWADGRYDRLRELTDDLVRRRVAVIAALGTSAPGRAAIAATTTIPIVFQTGGDPVEERLVASMNRPGGNITGVSRMNVATDPKRLELLHATVPNAATIAYLVNPTSPRSASQVGNIEDAARSLGLELRVVNASAAQDLDAAFAAMPQAGAAALLLGTDPAITALLNRIVELAVRHAMPTMSSSRAFVVAGGLMSYDASLSDSFRQAGIYVGRILNGEKPGDLPVMQPTKFEFVINLKTAIALGIKIPDKLLAIADEVIE